jgi:hypothetical protein
MNLRTHRRRQARRWDSVHNSFHNDSGIYSLRNHKPCATYDAGCIDCNTALFISTKGRFPHNMNELWAFHAQQETN